MAAGISASRHSRGGFAFSVVAETEISVADARFVVAKRQSTIFFNVNHSSGGSSGPPARHRDNDFLGRGTIPGSPASCLPDNFVIT